VKDHIRRRRHLPGEPLAALDVGCRTPRRPRPGAAPTRDAADSARAPRGARAARGRAVAAFFDAGDHAIASASPERFLELRGRASRRGRSRARARAAGAGRGRALRASCWRAPRIAPRT
jgi:hypothetical protein